MVVSIFEFEKLNVDGADEVADETNWFSNESVEFLSITFKVMKLPPIAPKNELPIMINMMIRTYKIFFGSITNIFTSFSVSSILIPIYKYNIRMKIFTLLFSIIILALAGCSPEKTSQEYITPTVEKTKTIIFIEKQAPTFTLTVVPTTTPEPTEDLIDVCSPLVDYSIENLVDMISNPFYPPKAGSDDPHQGVDFSVIDPDLRIALKGSAVQSILAGEVVMVMNDRFPYGNAILVETPFYKLPAAWKEKLENQIQPDLFGTKPSLTCPTGWDLPNQENNDLSLYVLYAHLDTNSVYTLGDQINCGEQLGLIGDSGNALAPHLHIEMRYGHASGIEGSMAHYTVSADEQEMRNYCRWRVSGWFRLLDPMDLFFTNPNP